MSLWYCKVAAVMRFQGIQIPSFIPDGKNSNNFLPFIDKLKDFAKNLSETNPGFLPDSFLDFCDSYKNKLMQYGCK